MQSLRQSNSRQLAEYPEWQPLVFNDRGAPCTFLAGEGRNLHSDWSRVRESPLQKEGARSWGSSRGQLFGPGMRTRGEEPCTEGGREVAKVEPRTDEGGPWVRKEVAIGPCVAEREGRINCQELSVP